MVNNGERSNALVELVDLAPTLLEASEFRTLRWYARAKSSAVANRRRAFWIRIVMMSTVSITTQCRGTVNLQQTLRWLEMIGIS